MRQSGSGDGGRRRTRGGRHHGGRGDGREVRDSSRDGGNSSGGGGYSGRNGGGGRSVASLRSQSFDSNGPDVRVRGNAWQVYEKYQALARDATSSGDRIAAENYQQHAEHYYRVIEAINDAAMNEQRQQQRGNGAVAPQAANSSGAAYGQQPETPNSYYGQDGNVAVPPASSGEQPVSEQQQNDEAQVEMRRPAQPSPFYAPEDTDDIVGEQMVVNR